MNLIIEPHLFSFYPKLAVPTIKTYSYNIVKVLKIIDSKNLNDLYLRTDEIIEKVKKEFSEIGTRKGKFSSSVVYIKTLLTDDEDNEINKQIKEARKKYNSEIEIIKKETIKKLSTFEKTKHEDGAWLTNEEQKTIKDYLFKQIPETITNIQDLMHLRNAVIFMFYLDFPSRCEVSTSKIFFDDEIKIDELDKKWNYIILNKTKKTIDYILNNHKNANRCGPYTVSLSNSLYDLYSRYRNEIKILISDDWFVFKTNKINMSYENLSDLYSTFGNIINKKISIRVNRKIYTSDKVKIEELTDLSKRMGHSIVETIFVYSKK